jgi:hypothetical protein
LALDHQRRALPDGLAEIGDHDAFEELVGSLGIAPAVLVGLAEAQIAVADDTHPQALVVDLEIPGIGLGDLGTGRFE